MEREEDIKFDQYFDIILLEILDINKIATM